MFQFPQCSTNEYFLNSKNQDSIPKSFSNFKFLIQFQLFSLQLKFHVRQLKGDTLVLVWKYLETIDI